MKFFSYLAVLHIDILSHDILSGISVYFITGKYHFKGEQSLKPETERESVFLTKIRYFLLFDLLIAKENREEILNEVKKNSM